MNNYFTYENGLVVAFYVAIFDAIYIIIKKNSLYEKNLNKIGLRLSWLTLQPKEYDAVYKGNVFFKNSFKFLMIIVFFIISILSSWLYPTLKIINLLYFINNKFGMPQNIKEHIWKMHNLHMTKEHIIESSANANSLKDEEKHMFRETFYNDLRERGF